MSSSSSISVPGPSEASFWENRWIKGETQWHKTDVNPNLLKNINFFRGDSSNNSNNNNNNNSSSNNNNNNNNNNTNNRRILVPLCGKSIDLKYLYEQGFIVIGIEFIESAIIDFFNENKLLFPTYHYNKHGPDGSIQSYCSSDNRLLLIRSDIFSPYLLPDIIGGIIDYVWDRGSYVAIDPKDRLKYWNKILVLGGIIKLDNNNNNNDNNNNNNNDNKQLENTTTTTTTTINTTTTIHELKILLNVFSYNQLKKTGPPFSVNHHQFKWLINGGKEEEPKSDNDNNIYEIINNDIIIKENNYYYQLVTDDWYVVKENDKMRNRVYQIVYHA